MNAPTARLVRRNYGRNHGYLLDGNKVPGVTTILDALPKELKQWAANCAANYAVEHWDELSETPLATRLDKIRYAHKDYLAAAALRGTQIHTLGEGLVKGLEVQVPPEHRGPVEAYARFLDEWQIEPIAVETPLGSDLYGGFGGTADLWGTIGVRDGVRALIDLKTGNVYESVALQLAAYRFAKWWQPDGPASECDKSPDDVEVVYVAQIGPDNVRMLPVRAGEAEFRQFLYVMQTSKWLGRHGWKGDDPLIGEAEVA